MIDARQYDENEKLIDVYTFHVAYMREAYTYGAALSAARIALDAGKRLISAGIPVDLMRCSSFCAGQEEQIVEYSET